MALNFSELHRSVKFSDVTLRFGGREVHAHKLVLAWQSKYFEREFFGSFSEASSKVVELHDDDPDAMDGVIAALCGAASHGIAWFEERYSQTYDAEGRFEGHYMLYLVNLRIAWSKYMVQHAPDKIMAPFEDALSAQPFEWPALVRHVYTTHAEAARVFRAPIVAHCAASGNDLRILTGGSAGRDLLLEVPQFAVDLLATLAEVKGMKRYIGSGVKKTAPQTK
ncbi:Kelch-like protein 10 [Elasticomyces elasticus]|nr:Kelch-like protein 10 [Elasticomyces elasticus]KAK4911180.1 Kelch-like protein 10 [Elasticomyces elasticus]KAK5748017.1 Kelch-like protein 10 [Elasticomyces elasticus]